MGRTAGTVPGVFKALAGRRALIALGVATAVLGAAMLPAMQTMASHGASLISFENAGGLARSAQILGRWGDAGKAAAWWQLGIDTLFLLGYGALLAGGCAAVARRARAASKPRLQRLAALACWFGPIAAASDLAQNISLALLLAGHVEQPWPRVSAVANLVTLSFAAAALALIGFGLVVTSGRAAQVHTSGALPPRKEPQR
jgi:hypothetical protein